MGFFRGRAARSHLPAARMLTGVSLTTLPRRWLSPLQLLRRLSDSELLCRCVAAPKTSLFPKESPALPPRRSMPLLHRTLTQFRGLHRPAFATSSEVTAQTLIG